MYFLVLMLALQSVHDTVPALGTTDHSSGLPLPGCQTVQD